MLLPAGPSGPVDYLVCFDPREELLPAQLTLPTLSTATAPAVNRAQTQHNVML